MVFGLPSRGVKMATSVTTWKSEDNRTFTTQQEALDHEAAVKARIATWLETTMAIDLTIEENRTTAAATIFNNFVSFLEAMEGSEDSVE
jgi:hypothetical protein